MQAVTPARQEAQKRCGATPLVHRIRNYGCTYGKRHKYKHIDAKVHAHAEGVAPLRIYEGIATQPITHLECMAGTTGLEPATSAVTGQRSDQLSYVPRLFFNNLVICHIESSVS